MPSLLTQDTLNPSFYGMRIIATELEGLIDALMTKVLLLPWPLHHAYEIPFQEVATMLCIAWLETPLVRPPTAWRGIVLYHAGTQQASEGCHAHHAAQGVCVCACRGESCCAQGARGAKKAAERTGPERVQA